MSLALYNFSPVIVYKQSANGWIDFATLNYTLENNGLINIDIREKGIRQTTRLSKKDFIYFPSDYNNMTTFKFLNPVHIKFILRNKKFIKVFSNTELENAVEYLNSAEEHAKNMNIFSHITTLLNFPERFNEACEWFKEVVGNNTISNDNIMDLAYKTWNFHIQEFHSISWKAEIELY